jgi:holo-[acyl-carrier protein] synthase
VIIGVGIDIVDVRRVGELLRGHGQRFTSRIFTGAELAECRAGPGRVKKLAARVAAKEALFKALGLGVAGGVTWKEAEVVKAENGKPDLLVHGKTKKLVADRNIRRIHCSISHTDELASAYVILEG